MRKPYTSPMGTSIISVIMGNDEVYVPEAERSAMCRPGALKMTLSRSTRRPLYKANGGIMHKTKRVLPGVS
jgi:hypothetical protein